MFHLILSVHLLLCVVLVVLVLLQQGKGADAGAAFSGGANTLFGAGGATPYVVKATTACAIAFMVTSILLVNTFQERQAVAAGAVEGGLQGSVMSNVPATKPQEEEKKAELPAGVPAAPEAKSVAGQNPAADAATPQKGSEK